MEIFCSEGFHILIFIFFYEFFYDFVYIFQLVGEVYLIYFFV